MAVHTNQTADVKLDSDASCANYTDSYHASRVHGAARLVPRLDLAKLFNKDVGSHEQPSTQPSCEQQHAAQAHQDSGQAAENMLRQQYVAQDNYDNNAYSTARSDPRSHPPRLALLALDEDGHTYSTEYDQHTSETEDNDCDEEYSVTSSSSIVSSDWEADPEHTIGGDKERYLCFGPTTSQERFRAEELVQKVSPELKEEVMQLWTNLQTARASCESMAIRGQRLLREVSTDWQRTATVLLKQVQGQAAKLAQYRVYKTKAQAYSEMEAKVGHLQSELHHVTRQRDGLQLQNQHLSSKLDAANNRIDALLQQQEMLAQQLMQSSKELQYALNDNRRLQPLVTWASTHAPSILPPDLLQYPSSPSNDSYTSANICYGFESSPVATTDNSPASFRLPAATSGSSSSLDRQLSWRTADLPGGATIQSLQQSRPSRGNLSVVIPNDNANSAKQGTQTQGQGTSLFDSHSLLLTGLGIPKSPDNMLYTVPSMDLEPRNGFGATKNKSARDQMNKSPKNPTPNRSWSMWAGFSGRDLDIPEDVH